jgi:hypothetical protein
MLGLAVTMTFCVFRGVGDCQIFTSIWDELAASLVLLMETPTEH